MYKFTEPNGNVSFVSRQAKAEPDGNRGTARPAPKKPLPPAPQRHTPKKNPSKPPTPPTTLSPQEKAKRLLAKQKKRNIKKQAVYDSWINEVFNESPIWQSIPREDGKHLVLSRDTRLAGWYGLYLQDAEGHRDPRRLTFLTVAELQALRGLQLTEN